jgi:hypothetical protein
VYTALRAPSTVYTDAQRDPNLLVLPTADGEREPAKKLGSL